MSASQLKDLRESFFKTVFSLLGRMANCDGYINRDEIKRTQTYMDKMQLSADCKRKAIQLFRQGASPQFNTAQVVKDFHLIAKTSPTIIEVLLIYLINLARVDGLLVEKELKVVREVASGLGYSSIIFDHLLRTLAAQEMFSGDYSSQSSQFKQDHNAGQREEKSQSSSKPEKPADNGDMLNAAYEVLGLQANANPADVKKSYQKLVSRFHPDKLQGQGLPPELIKSSTEQFKKIQGAYDFIKKYANKFS